jgi:hypothetical protein
VENIDSIIDRIIIERNKSVDSAVIMEIQKIAIENGIETKFILNEKNIIDAFKKQILQKPKGDYQSCPHYRCPTCHSSVKMYETDNTYPHCAFCGQKLDWGGANG